MKAPIALIKSLTEGSGLRACGTPRCRVEARKRDDKRSGRKPYLIWCDSIIGLSKKA
jgi:hypothetical protein